MNVLNHFQHSILNDSTADLYTYKTHSQIWIDIAMEDIELSFDIQIFKSLTKSTVLSCLDINLISLFVHHLG